MSELDGRSVSTEWGRSDTKDLPKGSPGGLHQGHPDQEYHREYVFLSLKQRSSGLNTGAKEDSSR